MRCAGGRRPDECWPRRLAHELNGSESGGRGRLAKGMESRTPTKWWSRRPVCPLLARCGGVLVTNVKRK